MTPSEKPRLEKGDSHVEWSEMLVGKFNLNPMGDQCACSSNLFDHKKVHPAFGHIAFLNLFE